MSIGSIGRDELVRQFHAVDRMEGRVGAVAAHVIAKAPGTFSLRLHELRQRRDAIIRLLADSAKPETTTPAE